jgi:hypothetical protein
MNNRNQQTARTPAPAEATAPTYLNVFTVEEYENNGKLCAPQVDRLTCFSGRQKHEGFCRSFQGRIYSSPKNK